MWALIFITALLLNGIDWLISWYILKHGGLELNPITKKLGLKWAKIIEFGIIIICFILSPKTSIIFAVIFWLACVWNGYQCFKEKRINANSSGGQK
jgi:hypothetical protein